MCRLRRSARTAHQTSVRMRPSTRQNRSPRWKKSEKSRASWSLGIPRLQLARDFSDFFHLGERFWRVDGRILTDVWWAVRAERLSLHMKQETLDYVGRQLLGEGKHELSRRKIDEEWAKDREKVIRYCLNDADLSLRILEKIGRIEKTLDLAAVSKLPLEDVLHGRTSNLIDSILIRAADRARVAVPMMKMRGGRVEQIEGGYVHSLQPGLYEWVISLDFRAMYPSLIIENNICFTTVSPNGTIVSPTGAKFLPAEVKKGLLPVILTNLMKDRQEVRTKQKAATDPQMKDFYEGLQAAIKILMNAFYGVLASSLYRFNDPKVGASITAFARDRIKGIIGELEAEQVKVVYADTDSVFFQSPSPGPEESLAFARKTAERFSRGRISMEVDKIYETLFSHGRKKRYAGKVAWPERCGTRWSSAATRFGGRTRSTCRARPRAECSRRSWIGTRKARLRWRGRSCRKSGWGRRPWTTRTGIRSRRS